MVFLLTLLNLLVSAFLTGLIWFVQAVHYPLFRRVPPAVFGAYEQAHQQATGLLVGPAMVVELALAVALLVHRPPASVAWAAYAAAACVGLVWGVTFLVSVPLHNQLVSGGHQPDVIGRLVATNWVRTVAWTVRTGLLAWLLWKLRAG